MGYFPTIESKSAVPENSWVPQKTHTPASAVKDRGHRYYSANLARWINRDPIEEEGGLGVYIYCRNAPVFEFDYLGLSSCCEQTKDKVYKEYGAQIDSLKKRGCFTDIDCAESCDGFGGRYYPDPDNGGKYRICITASESMAKNRSRILHELQHAAGSCGKRKDGCEACLKSELKALRCGGQGLDWYSLAVNCMDSCPYDKKKHKAWLPAYQEQVNRLWTAISSEKCWYEENPAPAPKVPKSKRTKR